MIEGKFTWFFSLNCAWNIRFYDLKLPSCDDAGAQFVLSLKLHIVLSKDLRVEED